MTEQEARHYRLLKEGEIIHPFDDVLVDSKTGWESPGLTIGMKAPDHRFTAHCIYRRQVDPDTKEDLY